MMVTARDAGDLRQTVGGIGEEEQEGVFVRGRMLEFHTAKHIGAEQRHPTEEIKILKK
jgi:hypothetical protein